MQPAQFDFALVRGDDQVVAFLFKDGDGAPIDLTGAALVLTVRLLSPSTLVPALVVDAVNGRVEWRAAPADTNKIPPGRIARYALARTDGAEGHRTYLVGNISGTSGPSAGDVTAELAITDGPIEITVTTTGALPGIGVPVGGSTGQVLAKNSGADFDTEWVAQSGGGGGGGPFPISDITGLQTALDGEALTRAAADTALGNRLTPVESKLAGIASGATANSTDAQMRDRTTHTGAQAISTVTGLQTALDAKALATDLASEVAARTAAVAGLQPLDSDLTAIAALATTTFGRALLTMADAPTLRSVAGLGTAALSASTDFQPVDSDLTAIAALTTTTYGRALLTMADAAATKVALAITKADVGLGNVDNTADTAKPISTLQQAGLDGKQALSSTLTSLAGSSVNGVSLVTAANYAAMKVLLAYAISDVSGLTAALAAKAASGANSDITSLSGLTTALSLAQGGTGATSAAGAKTALSLVKGDVGLGNVDNTADTAKPVSTAQQTALNAKAAILDTLNTQTGTTYTLASTDAGLVVELSNASAITLTLPNSLPVGFNCIIRQAGAGQVTLSLASGATLRNRQSLTKTAGQWSELSLSVRTNSGGTTAEYVMSGDAA
jgi:hypothetical protein